MAIKIKMSGSTISDNAQVLNGLHVPEEPQSYSKQKHKDFEYEISRGGTLKGIDVSVALRYVNEEIAKEQKVTNRSTNNRDEK